ncbi:MAG TPA: LytTR family DNA-binding domain-containing protein, partial [Chitinophagaceae bacterium]|nr:LytTR family DNA-binding domain-containing protein [Chitinophagaceae bacterium]
DKEMKKIFVNEIFYIESLKDYVRIYLGNDRFLLVKQSIRSMENLLSEHKFLRVHRSFIVSMDKISSFNRLTVKVGTLEIPIGRLYKQAVMERIQTS